MDTNFKTTTIRNLEATYLQLSHEGVPAIFYPANGFPLGTYTEFLKQLAPKFQLSCLSLRACWPNIGAAPREMDWEIYADDLIAFIEQKYTEPIVAIGHSQGASASVIAASKRPGLFKSLIIIEPALVSEAISFVLKVTPYFLKKFTEPLKGALRKPDIWESREAFYMYCRGNRTYKRISNKVLNDFALHGLEPTENGKFKLVFSSQWEAANYAKAQSIMKYLEKVNTPIQLILGKPTMFSTQETRDKWRQISPDSVVRVNNEYGHLIPLEAPEICADLIMV